MENIEIVHINSFPYMNHIDDIAEIVFEAIKSKYLITFEGDEGEIKNMIFNMVKEGLFPLEDGFFAIDKNEKVPVGLLVLLTNKRLPVFKALKQSLRLMYKLGYKKMNKLSKASMIIEEENMRFNDIDNISFINLIAVKEKCRGKGIGKMLIKYTVDNVKYRCKCLGSDCSCKINLICSSEGFLKNFYESLGFKSLLEVESDELSTVMGKEYRKILHMSKYL